MVGTVKARLRNGRFLVRFDGDWTAWFSPWEAAKFEHATMGGVGR